MSASDDAMLKDLGQRARARADEAARIETMLRGVPASSARIDGILAALAPHASTAAPAPRVPARPPRLARLAWITGATSFAAVAAVLLVAGAPRRGPARAPLGPYVVSVSGHVEIARAASDGAFGALEARPGSIQEVVVRPREATPGPLAARVVVVRGGVGERAGVAPEISDRGAVRFELPGEALVGASEVRVAIAAPDAVDALADQAAHDDATTSADAVVVRVPVEPPSEKTTTPR